MSGSHTIRVTGVLLHQGRLLLVRQVVDGSERWSLPGGKLEPGETIADGLVREMREETGLAVRIVRLLYVCDKPEADLVHLTFLVATDSIAELRLPGNELETAPITAIELVPPAALPQYGFIQAWADLVVKGFPGAPGYAGHKTNIGLA